MITLQGRIDYFDYIISLLTETNSRNEKLAIIEDIPDVLKEDFNYIVECLNGKHKFGYKYYYTTPIFNRLFTTNSTTVTVKNLLEFLQGPIEEHNLTELNIKNYISHTTTWYDFLEPIVNRTLKLGIGNSLLDKTDLTPMLAKKFEGDVKFDNDGYYITEKLDGNRCIAHYENGHWEFTSRNGKPMHVDFDMTGFDTTKIYDGEVLAPIQVAMSHAIASKVIHNINPGREFDDNFNSTSGLINQHTKDKKLIYNVFDIIENTKYKERREQLDKTIVLSDNTRILPVLMHYKSADELANISSMLDDVVNIGGEGLMINLANADYMHKRTDQLLKLKKVYTMDMNIYGYQEGTGKYEGMVGALEAFVKTDDGKEIFCLIGTGLSDEQREEWSIHPERIVGKIVEVSYFSICQNKENKGTNTYSLRFPRLKKVRGDKNETSEY